jgi:hypothetical protein
MTNKIRVVIFLAVLITGASAKARGQSPSVNSAGSTSQLSQKASDLVSAANQYKTSLEALIPVYEGEQKKATEVFEKRKELFAQGIISKRELEASEQAVKEAQALLNQARKQITESDQLIAEAKNEKETLRSKVVLPSRSASGNYSATSTVMRYGGSAGWSLTQASKVQSFFASKFGRTLPVSAYGQSNTHNRMGYDHRNSMDVALHPDSAEGKALMAYLRSSGIPFIAFRSAVPGSSTGAHIHVGYPSRRTG